MHKSSVSVFLFMQTLMNVMRDQTSVTLMLTAVTPLGVMSVPALLVILEMESYVVSVIRRYCTVKGLICMPLAKDCRDGEILLYDGSTLSTNHSNGTVLVCLDNEYGTVCDDWWDPLDATVVCTQLGFSANGLL